MTTQVQEIEIHKNLVFLKKIGCCLKCSFRLCGKNCFEENVLLKNFVSEVEKSSPELDVEDNPCIVCLGILQNKTLTLLTNKILNELNEIEFDYHAISYTLTIPNAVRIRERILHVYLSKKNVLPTSNDINKIINIKDVWKVYLSQKIKSLINYHVDILYNSSPLTIDVFMSYLEDEKECTEMLKKLNKLLKISSLNNNNKRTYITKKFVDNILNILTDKEVEEYLSCPPQVPTHFINIDKLLLKRDSLFIGGRYTKFSRRLCQTPWLVNGKYKMKTSVQELISNYILQLTKAETIKFISSGREDVDVRMLLSGRPFAIEFINPKITKIPDKDLQHIEDKINHSTEKVNIGNSLKIINKNHLRKLKEGESSKAKSYRALCICKNVTNSLLKKLQNMHNIEIIQNTPIRVLHRRTLCPRKRFIYQIRARFPNSKELEKYKTILKRTSNNYEFVILDLKTQAGTYIKEFIHGDFGRTVPNLCYLLDSEIDIVALDVTNICLEWP